MSRANRFNRNAMRSMPLHVLPRAGDRERRLLSHNHSHAKPFDEIGEAVSRKLRMGYMA